MRLQADHAWSRRWYNLAGSLSRGYNLAGSLSRLLALALQAYQGSQTGLSSAGECCRDNCLTWPTWISNNRLLVHVYILRPSSGTHQLDEVIGHGLVVIVDGVHHCVDQDLLVLLTELCHVAEVHVRYPPVPEGEDVARVWVSVKQAKLPQAFCVSVMVDKLRVRSAEVA